MHFKNQSMNKFPSNTFTGKLSTTPNQARTLRLPMRICRSMTPVTFSLSLVAPLNLGSLILLIRFAQLDGINRLSIKLGPALVSNTSPSEFMSDALAPFETRNLSFCFWNSTKTFSTSIGATSFYGLVVPDGLIWIFDCASSGPLQEVLVSGSFIVTIISVESLSPTEVGFSAISNAYVANLSCSERTSLVGEGSVWYSSLVSFQTSWHHATYQLSSKVEGQLWCQFQTASSTVLQYLHPYLCFRQTNLRNKRHNHLCCQDTRDNIRVHCHTRKGNSCYGWKRIPRSFWLMGTSTWHVRPFRWPDIFDNLHRCTPKWLTTNLRLWMHYPTMPSASVGFYLLPTMPTD